MTKYIYLSILILVSSVASASVNTGDMITSKKFNGSTLSIGSIQHSLLTEPQIQQFQVQQLITSQDINHNLDVIEQELTKVEETTTLERPNLYIKKSLFENNLNKLNLTHPLSDNIYASEINSYFNHIYNHLQTFGASTCLKTQLTNKTNSTYLLKRPEGRISYECDMTTDDGGWTKVIDINQNETTYNAYPDMESFNPKDILIKVDDQPKMIYSNLNLEKVFDPTPIETIQTTPFMYKTINGDWHSCNDNIKHANTRWNWSISENSTGCSSHNFGNGFILHGNSTNSESASIIYGLNEYSGSNFTNVKIYVREQVNQEYPRSCKHLSDGIHTIDPDGDQIGIDPLSTECKDGYTLVHTFKGNETTLSYIDDPNVFWKTRQGVYGYLKAQHIKISNGTDHLVWDIPNLPLYDLINDGAQIINSAGNSSGYPFNSNLSYRQSSNSTNLALRYGYPLKMKCQDSRSGASDHAVMGFQSNTSSDYYCEGFGYPEFGNHNYRYNTRWYNETVGNNISINTNGWNSDSKTYKIWVK